MICTPDWTTGEQFEDYINRIEKNAPKKKCYVCNQYFYECEIIEDECLTCNTKQNELRS